MKRYRKLLIVALITIGCLLAIRIGAHRIDANRRQRQAHFFAIHYMCRVAKMEEGRAARDLHEVFRIAMGDESGTILRTNIEPFPEGLHYQASGKSFILAEPRPRWISLFRKDRLIATDSKLPSWERSRELAPKSKP